MLNSSEAGFTMVEVIVALVILSAAVLGLATTATSLTTAAATAEVRAQALYAAQDRVGRIEVDRRYDSLEALYAGNESDILEAPGYDRTTTVEHVSQSSPALDYKVVTVTVSGPALASPVERGVVVAAP